MTSIRGQNWLTVLSTLPSNQVVNEHMAEVLGLVSYHHDEATCIENISKNPGLAILLVDGFSELMVLHNMHCLQANVYRAVPKLVALCGEGVTADCYRIDPTTSFSNLEFNTPLWRDLKGVTDEEGIKKLFPQEQPSSTFKGKRMMLIPPLVLSTILEAKSLSPVVLIPALSAKFQEFDRSSTTVKACTVLRPVLEFLWGVYHKKVPSAVLGLDHSQEAKDWSERMHLASVIPAHLQVSPPMFAPPPPPVPNPPQDQSSLIVGELRLLRDAQERQHLREVTNDEEKKKESNGWEKLPEEVQKMVLRMSAITDEYCPTSPADSYLKILKQAKAIGVATVLNLNLSMKGCQVEVPMTFANAVKTGNFRANSQMVAHPFSIFNLPYIEAAHMANYNKLELDVLLTKGDSIPKEVAKKLTENKAKCPENTHQLRHQLNNWYGVMQICFGKDALISKEARNWIEHIDQFELSNDARFKTNPDFGAKVLGLIDLTFFQFCDSCLKAESFDDVNFSVISLEQDRYGITRNSFQADLPPFLVLQQKKKNEQDNSDSEEEPRKKRSKIDKDERDKSNFRDLGGMVKNQNQVQEWKVLGSKYKKIFNKELMASTPAFNETGLITCNKWHVQGFCYEKCERKASHKPFSSATHKAAYDKWVKEQKAKAP
jgi:hypothetical protein